MIDRGIEYDELFPVYEEVERTALNLITNALDGSGIHIHQIAHRIKEKDSALEKPSRKSTKYSFISEFTDIVGFRIICYFSEQVNAVVERIAGICGADIVSASPESYIVLLNKLGVTKVGDLYKMMDEYGDKAFMLAEKTLIKLVFYDIIEWKGDICYVKY